MKNTQQLAQRFEEVMLTGKWIANTNYKEILADLTWQEATQKTGNLNTLAMLSFHISYYLTRMLEVLSGGQLTISDKYSFDMPPITNTNQWNTLYTTLVANATTFTQQIYELANQQLQQIFVLAQYGTYQRNIEGITEHAYYHLDQIALIKK